MSKALARTHCGSARWAVAGRDVVGDRVPQDDVVGVLHGDVLGEGLDDDGELGLVVDLLAPGGQDDGSVRSDDRSVGFEEDHRIARRLVLPHLDDVARVVLPDPHDLGARDDR